MADTDIHLRSPSKEADSVIKDEFSFDSGADDRRTTFVVMDVTSPQEYRLYKQRFVGITALVSVCLSLIL